MPHSRFSAHELTQIPGGLKSAFQVARRASEFARSFVFLELFLGSGAVSAALRRRGVAAISLDARFGASFDMSNRRVQSTVMGWARGGCLAGIWVSPPSQLHCHPTLFSFVRRLFQCAWARGTPAFLEGPIKARWWPEPQLPPDAQWHRFDACGWGGRFRHSVTIASWNAPPNQELLYTCSGPANVCLTSGKTHIHEFGRCRESGVPWHKIACRFTKALAGDLAQWMWEAFRSFISASAMSVLNRG